MKQLKKLVITGLVVGGLFGSMSVPVSANSTNWNGGTFTWSLTRSGSTVTARTGFSSNIRLVTSLEIRNNATGAHIISATLDSPSTTGHSIARTGLTTGRAAFASHEARGTTAIARYTSMAL